ITKVNNPRVRILKGKVKKSSAGRIMALTMPKIAEANRAEPNPDSSTPSTKKVVNNNAMALTNHLNNNPCMLTPPRSYFASLFYPERCQSVPAVRPAVRAKLVTAGPTTATKIVKQPSTTTTWRMPQICKRPKAKPSEAIIPTCMTKEKRLKARPNCSSGICSWIKAREKTMVTGLTKPITKAQGSMNRKLVLKPSKTTQKPTAKTAATNKRIRSNRSPTGPTIKLPSK